MRNDTAQSLMRAANAGRAAAGGTARGRAFITLLFAVIALFLLLALLMGMSAYRAANDVRESAAETRLGLALIANSIRMNDALDAVGVSEGPEGRALVLTERGDHGVYETRLYAYEGSIVEEYARADAPYAPEKARAVVASERFDFAYENGLLTVFTDQGSSSVALRSVRGGS